MLNKILFNIYFRLFKKKSSVRRSFDRVINNEAGLTVSQCRQVLSTLGYRKDLISIENLKRILNLVRNVLSNRHEPSSAPSSSSQESSPTDEPSSSVNGDTPTINFEEFCVISSYLSVLQQEIEENCCVSPIKGTNLPPPPIYLTNTPGNYFRHPIFVNHNMRKSLNEIIFELDFSRNDSQSVQQTMFTNG